MIVTPLAGVWIEIQLLCDYLIANAVTPLAGVWIEIRLDVINELLAEMSLPSRECGLKCLVSAPRQPLPHRHSPRGSVD